MENEKVVIYVICYWLGQASAQNTALLVIDL
ncbi:hypothetical protein PEDI_15230 [Persicobacter diffluens]|uniref:Uncharacterized protein n=1 Tax=Persicobacter diffluens TaxID=981 RepID=A0AAN5AL05_9BACT|nr:hypothetical protein PEDI_15230 [Persicobacter diffluens]